MAGEMLAAGRHASQPQALDQGAREHGHHAGIPMEGSVANDATDAVIEVENGSKTEVDPAGPQLGCEHIADIGRNAHRHQRILHPPLPQRAHAWQHGKAIGAKPLYPTAFVINGNQQARPAQFVNAPGEGDELVAAFKIACKQDDPAHQRMRQALALGIGEHEPCDVDHQRPARNGNLFFLSGHASLPSESDAAIRAARPRPRRRLRRIRIHR